MYVPTHMLACSVYPCAHLVHMSGPSPSQLSQALSHAAKRDGPFSFKPSSADAVSGSNTRRTYSHTAVHLHVKKPHRGSAGMTLHNFQHATIHRSAASVTHLSPHPWERARGTHWIGGWVGPKFGLDVFKRSQISCPWQDLKLRSCNLWSSHYTDWANPELYTQAGQKRSTFIQQWCSPSVLRYLKMKRNYIKLNKQKLEY